jgi:hypothetical protein
MRAMNKNKTSKLATGHENNIKAFGKLFNLEYRYTICVDFMG